MLLGISKLMEEAYEASAKEARGVADLHSQLAVLILRAQALDPSLGEDTTVGEAIMVLKRHGEPVGVSEEVLEMIVKVPR